MDRPFFFILSVPHISSYFFNSLPSHSSNCYFQSSSIICLHVLPSTLARNVCFLYVFCSHLVRSFPFSQHHKKEEKKNFSHQINSHICHNLRFIASQPKHVLFSEWHVILCGEFEVSLPQSALVYIIYRKHAHTVD